MMHKSRDSSIFVPSSAAILLFFFFFLWGPTTTTRADTAMQLSRAELVHLAGYGEEKLSSVLVTGTLLCAACPQPGSDQYPSQLAGAKVAVACKTEGKSRRTDWAYGATDEYGEFIIDLPSHLHAIPKLEEACVVRVLRLPNNSICRKISRVNIPRGIKLSSIGNGIRVYTTGTVRLQCKPKALNGAVSSTW